MKRTPKGDKHKVQMAIPLRRETTMSLERVAQRLAMGSWTHVSNLPGAGEPNKSVNSECGLTLARIVQYINMRRARMEIREPWI